MIKKSLILAGLMISSSNLVASDFINIGYSTGSTSYTNGSSDIDDKGTSFSFKRIHTDYLLTVGYAKVTAESNKLIFSDEPNETYKYDYDGSGFGLGFAYKVIKKDEIFFAPYLSYSINSFDTKFTRNSDGAKFVGTETSDNDLEVSFMFGYDYAEDSFAYVDYSIDDDILESEDEDYNALTLGINHKLNDKFKIDFSYSQDMSNPDNRKSSSSIFFGLGYKFQ